MNGKTHFIRIFPFDTLYEEPSIYTQMKLHETKGIDNADQGFLRSYFEHITIAFDINYFYDILIRLPPSYYFLTTNNHAPSTSIMHPISIMRDLQSFHSQQK